MCIRDSITAFDRKQHPAQQQIHEDRDVVLTLCRRRLIQADFANLGEVQLGSLSGHVVLDHPPDTGVVFPGDLAHLGNWHRRGEGDEQRLEQQGESRPRTSPRDVDLVYPVLMATHPRSGSRRESHPPAPTDPYVSLSAHTTLLTQLSERDRPPLVREQTGCTSRDRCPPRLGSFERS